MTTKTRNLDDPQAAIGAFIFCIRCVLLIVLFMPLIVSTSTFFPFVVGKAIFYRIFIEIAFLMWVPLIILSPKLRNFKSPIVIVVSMYMLIAAVASFTGVSSNISIWSTYERMQGLFDLLHWFAYFIMVGSIFTNSSQWKIFLSVNLLVSALVCFIGLSQYLGFHGLISNFAENNPSERIQSSLGNAAYVGAYCVANIFIAAALISKSVSTFFSNTSINSKEQISKRNKSKSGTTFKFKNTKLEFIFVSFWTVCLTANTITLLLSGTRGAWLGFGVAFLFTTVLYAVVGKVKYLKRICIAFTIFFILFLAIFISFRDTDFGRDIGDTNVIAGRLIEFNFNDSSVMSRWHTWRAGIKASIDKPILGWGTDNFVIAWGRHFDASDTVKEKFDQAHNKLIEELTTKGLIGLIAYSSIWVVLAYSIVKNYKNSKSAGTQSYLLLISAALVGYFTQNLFLFDTSVTYSQFIVLIALISSVNQSFWSNSKENYTEYIGSPNIKLNFKTTSLHLSRKLVVYAASIILIPIIIYSIYSFSIKTYTASQHIVYLTADNYPSWEEKVSVYNSAINDAPSLANYPRILMIEGIAEDWYEFTPEIKIDAYNIVEKAAIDGLDQEPESWRLTYILARFYQIASTDNPSLMDKADYYVDRIEELAPGTVEAKVARDINNRAHEFHQSQTIE